MKGIPVKEAQTPKMRVVSMLVLGARSLSRSSHFARGTRTGTALGYNSHSSYVSPSREATDGQNIPDAHLGDEEHVHVGNEVDKLLVQGRKDEGIQGIFKVMLTHGSTFSGENYVTAVYQLVKAGAAQKLASEADWGRVRGMLEKGLEGMDSRHLAGMVAGLAQLGLKQDGILGKTSAYLSEKISNLEPHQLVESVKELRNVDLPDGGKDLFGAVQARAQETAEKFTDELKQDLEWAEDKFGLKSQESDKLGQK